LADLGVLRSMGRKGSCLALCFFALLSVGKPDSAFAKGPASTWSIEPAVPRPGQTATLTMHTWHWKVPEPGGEAVADLTRPWDQPSLATIYEGFDLRAYPLEEFPPRGDRARGEISLRLKADPPSEYHARLTFLRSGDWIVASVVSSQGSANRNDYCRLVVSVRISGVAQEPRPCPEAPEVARSSVSSHSSRLNLALIAIATASIGGLGLSFRKHWSNPETAIS
jgi:hypothetical protein